MGFFEMFFLVCVACLYAWGVAWFYFNSDRSWKSFKAALRHQKLAQEQILSGILKNEVFCERICNIVNAESKIPFMESYACETFQEFCILQLKFFEKNQSGVFDSMIKSIIQEYVQEMFSFQTVVYSYEKEYEKPVKIKSFYFAVNAKQAKALDEWYTQNLKITNPAEPTLEIPAVVKKKN